MYVLNQFPNISSKKKKTNALFKGNGMVDCFPSKNDSQAVFINLIPIMNGVDTIFLTGLY